MKNKKNRIGDLIYKKQIISNDTFFRYLFLAIIISIAFIYGLSFTTMNDGFWHIKVGEYIIKNRTVPLHDIFSWYGKSMNLKWISHEWLFGIVVYLVYSISGFFSLSVFMGIVNALTVILLYYLIKIRTKDQWISLFLTSLYLMFLSKDMTLSLRPIYLSLIIILVTCILLEKKKYLFAMLALIIGINVHGGIYPVYIVIFAYYTLFKNNKYFLASVMCIIINPNTYNLYLYTIKSMQEMTFEKGFIKEWGTVPLYDFKISLIIIVITALVYALARLSLRDIIFSGAFILLSITSYRQLCFLPIAVIPIISPYLKNAIDVVLDNYLFQLKLFKNTKTLFKVDRKVFLKSLIFVIFEVAFLCTNVKYSYSFFNNGMPLFKVNPASNPVYASDYINKHPEIKNSHLFSHYNDSQYIIFRGIPSFVDSRADLFMSSYNSNTEAFYDFMLAIEDGYKPENLITKYKFNYILINKSLGIYNTFKSYKNLEIIYGDKNYCIFKVNYYTK